MVMFILGGFLQKRSAEAQRGYGGGRGGNQQHRPAPPRQWSLAVAAAPLAAAPLAATPLAAGAALPTALLAAPILAAKALIKAKVLSYIASLQLRPASPPRHRATSRRHYQSNHHNRASYRKGYVN